MMTKESKMRKALKKIGKGLVALLLLLIVAVGVIAVVDHIKDGKEWEMLQQAGYVNRVSVGSHELNVCIRGREDADYTIVGIAGLNNMAFVVDMEPVTDQLTDRYRFAMVDRSGYGLSEDTHKEQTVEQIVNDYRTALKNAGVKEPYVLMPHSIGGVYASYWQQTYPDEIKAVIYLDPTQIGDISQMEEEMRARHANAVMYLSVLCSKAGIDRLVFHPAEYTVGLRTEQQKEYATMIWRRCPMPWTVCSEENNYFDNIRKTAEKLSPNDIPKLYIDAQAYTVEDMREKVDYALKIAQEAGKKTTDIMMMSDNVDDRAADAMKVFYEQNIKTYTDKLGNVTYVNISGDHSIFKHKPDEVAEAIGDFLGTLE